MGRPISEETKRKIGLANRGKTKDNPRTKIVICFHCGKQVKKFPCNIKKRTFCSHECSWAEQHTKPELEPTEIPDSEDIAWVAGIYEGEGSIAKKYSSIRISQNDRWILDKIRDWFGGSVRFQQITKAGNPHYVLDIHGKKAQMFLRLVYKRLSPRRKKEIPIELREQFMSQKVVMPTHVADYVAN